MTDDEIRADILSYEDIRARADEFLAEHHPSGEIPIPIENIIEKRLRMDIVPMRGLRDLIEAEGFTTSDLAEIWVDENTYDRWTSRYRFTLAHEVGHVVLHREVFERGSWTTQEEWREFVNSIPEDQHSWFEYQAYSFGGLVLVPQGKLLEFTQEAVDQIHDAGLNLTDHWNFAWARIAKHLSQRFDVSTQVIDKRLDRDGVREHFRE